MRRIGITGATGLVGRRVVELLSDKFAFESASRTNGFDLADATPDTCDQAFPRADAILHLAARTDVDGIELERDQGETGNAWKINVGGTRALVESAERRRIPLILVSTDFVFAARSEGPHPEATAPMRSPTQTSWYGWTKLQAERAVLGARRNVVLRIAYPYVAHHPTRVDHARRFLQMRREGKRFPLYEDQLFTPSFVDDVAVSIGTILTKKLSGIFHCASTDRLTPLDFGTRLLHALGEENPELEAAPFPNEVAPGKARRPKRGGLLVSRARAQGLRVRPVDESLRDFAAQWRPTASSAF